MLRKYLIALLLMVLVCMDVAVAQAPAAAPAAPNLQEFDSLGNQSLADFGVPGVSVAVVQDGKVIYAKGFGYRDVEKKLPVTPDTLFAIGSVSKSFTSLIFAMQNDEGKVDWDKPIRTYLPTFKMDDPIASEH